MRLFRPGSIGIVIDDIKFSIAEKIIERKTGDGHHVFGINFMNKITEALAECNKVVEGDLSKYLDGSTVTVILEPTDFFTDDQLASICGQWRSEIGMKYDYGNLIWNKLFNIQKFTEDKKKICSEHVADGYSPYHRFLDKDPHNVSPYDILRDSIYRSDSKFKRYIICKDHDQPTL